MTSVVATVLILCCAMRVPAAAAAAAAAGCAWRKTTSPPAFIGQWASAAAAAVGDGAVAFAGGTFIDPRTGHFSGARNQVALVRPAAGTWDLLPNMTAREAPAAAAHGGRLYVFGGVQQKPNASHSDPDPTIKLALVESIAVAESAGGGGAGAGAAWQREKDMPYGPREGQSAVTLPSGKGIVLAGGFDSHTDAKGVFHFGYFNTSYHFDGVAYTRLPDMPFQRSNMALVAQLDGEDDWVYAIGGGEDAPSYATCARLRVPSAEPERATAWVSCGPMVNPRSWMAAAVVNNRIIIAGGMGGTFSPTNEVDSLDIGGGGSVVAANWTYAGCDLPVSVGFLAGAVASTGEFVVVAGDTRGNGVYIYEPSSL
jgi:hypothetical protein